MDMIIMSDIVGMQMMWLPPSDHLEDEGGVLTL